MSAIPATRLRRVLILSYLNCHNFGDRLGFQVVNAILPADVQVVHAALNFAFVPEGEFDLMILGLGQSLNAASILRPQLAELLQRIPRVIGIFGTQYPSQYRAMPPGQFDAFLNRLTTWWARYETDIRDYGSGLSDVRHLGDWLVSAFPMTEPRWDKTLVIEAEMRDEELPIDRVIQRIQAYRQVNSARLHPLLCALTSAERVCYQKQKEIEGSDEPSGKFDALLLDVFGRTYPEQEWFDVNRDAVVRYKRKVEANMAALRRQIVELLA